jgi:putative transposase
MEADPVHFLLQSVPAYSVSEIATKLKSLIAREFFLEHPEIKKELWGGSFLDKRALRKHCWVIW